MTRRWIVQAVLALTTSVLLTHEVLAQFGGGKPGGGGRGRPAEADVKREQRPVPSETLQEQVEYRLNALQEELKLHPDQYQSWASFSDRVKALAADMARERPVPVYATRNALRDINALADTARNRLTAMEDVAASAKALYDTLAPDQKTTADARLITVLPNSYAGAPLGAMYRR